MGCWNGTCFLTNLPIRCGERVVLIPIVKKNNNDSIFCYHNDLYDFTGYPIRGLYDDYGCIEEIDNNEASKRNFELFKDWLSNKELINTDNNEIKTIDELLNAIERGYILNNKLPISFIMMHENVYDSVINGIGKRKGYDTTITYKSNIKNRLIKKYDKQKEIEDLELEINKTETPDKTLLYKMLHLNLSDRDNIFDHFLSEYFIYSKNKQKLTKKIEPYFVELYLFNSALSLLRKILVPQCGAGSQCSEIFLHKIVANFVINKKPIDKETLFFRD